MSILSRLFFRSNRPAVSYAVSYANQFPIQLDPRDLEMILCFSVAPSRDVFAAPTDVMLRFAPNPYNAKRLQWAFDKAIVGHEEKLGALPHRNSDSRLAPPSRCPQRESSHSLDVMSSTRFRDIRSRFCIPVFLSCDRLPENLQRRKASGQCCILLRSLEWVCCTTAEN